MISSNIRGATIMSGKNIYIKSNYLIQAKYTLTSMEQKVLQLALSKIDQKDDDLKTYTLYVSEFIKKSKDDNSEVYNNIAEAVKRLMGRRLTFVTMEGNIREFNWVSYAEYFKGDKSRIEIGFDSRLKPYLLQLKNYTKLNLEITMKFKSIYSSRIYELLIQYLKFRSRKITILQIKDFLGLTQEQYPVYAEFKRTVLNKAITEINNITDLDVTYEEKTEEGSKKVIAIKFFIKSKDNVIAMSALPEPIDTNLEKLKEELKNDFAENDIIKFYEKSKKRYELVKSIYDLLQVYPEVKNAPAFMVYFIGEGNIITKEQIARYKTKNRGGFEQRNYTKKDFAELERHLLGRDDEAAATKEEKEEEEYVD